MRVDAEWLQDEIYWMVFRLLDDEIDVTGDDAGEMAAAAARAAVVIYERIMADESVSVCKGGRAMTRVAIEKCSGGSYVHVGYLDIDGDTYDIVAIGEERIRTLGYIASASTMPEDYVWTGDEVFSVLEGVE